MFHILLPLTIVPCHLPYIIGAITIKNGYILLLTTVPCCACLLLSIFCYHWYNFVYFVNLHFTFHMLLPLAIVPCHLSYSIGSFTLEMLEFLILTLPVVHVYRFPYMFITGDISFTFLLFILHPISCHHLP